MTHQCRIPLGVSDEYGFLREEQKLRELFEKQKFAELIERQKQEESKYSQEDTQEIKMLSRSSKKSETSKCGEFTC